MTHLCKRSPKLLNGLFLASFANKATSSVNEIFNPDRIDEFYATTDEERQKSISSDRATNYGVVRMELIEQIYHDMYMQKVESRNQNDWQRVILPRKEVVHIEQKALENRLAVHIRSVQKQADTTEQDVLHLDALVLATGYTRSTHEELCAPIEHLKPRDAGTDPKASGWKVNRDYSLALDRGKVSSGTNIWLQGCNESTHGISDSLLSVLATRSGEMVEAIFGDYLNGLRIEGHRKSGVRSML